MLAEIITFVGIVCAGVLTQAEAGSALNGPQNCGRKCPTPGRTRPPGLGGWAPPALRPSAPPPPERLDAGSTCWCREPEGTAGAEPWLAEA